VTSKHLYNTSGFIHLQSLGAAEPSHALGPLAHTLTQVKTGAVTISQLVERTARLSLVVTDENGASVDYPIAS
jgi:hypothetical protein